MTFGIGGVWSWYRFFAGDAGVSPAINYEKTRPKGATLSTLKGCKSTARGERSVTPGTARGERRRNPGGRQGERSVILGGVGVVSFLYTKQA